MEVTQIAQQAKRILIVDDYVDAAVTLSILLKLKGHEAKVAHDGINALAIAKSFLPHLAVIDICMPRMDGFELSSQLRQQDQLSEMVLIALTGSAMKVDCDRWHTAGFIAYFAKPIDIDQIEFLLTIPQP